MVYEIRKESVVDNLGVIQPLIEAHHNEVMIPFDAPSVSYEQYMALESHSLLHGIFAYLGDCIVGYVAFVISKHIHYKEVSVAQVTAIYVDPKHRGRLGLKLIKAAESEAKNAGANSMLWGVGYESRAAQTFERMGYSKRDISFVREL
jgi:GNAT superfamily N-acetyltransferase